MIEYQKKNCYKLEQFQNQDLHHKTAEFKYLIIYSTYESGEISVCKGTRLKISTGCP